jgi:tetratricopeptide (TPR) repeat protein
VIAVFRREVTDVASTAEGAAALAQFNRGEEVEALDVLDRLNAAEDEASRLVIEGATRALQLQADRAAAARRRSTAALALETRNRSRLGTDAVIARYEEVTRLDPSVDKDWLQLAELYLSVGRRAEAVSAAERVQTLTTSYWARSSARALIADILLAQGDSQGALAIYESVLAGHVRIFSADSSSLGVGIRVYRVVDKIGEAYLTRQDYASALERFGLALRLAERLFDSDPQSAELERYVSVSEIRIGDVLERQGDLDGALSRFRRGLEIFERLSAADPASLNDASNVAAALSRIGGVLVSQGDDDEALEFYRRSLEIADRLSAADPASADLARSVSISSSRIGDLTGERLYLERALAILRDLETRGALTEADRPLIARLEATLASPR